MNISRHIILMPLLVALLGASGVQAQPSRAMAQLPPTPYLPDPFLFDNGQRNDDLGSWAGRREEIISHLYKYEIGAKPHTPRANIKAQMVGDTLQVIITERGETLTLTAAIHYPEGKGPFPAMIGIGRAGGSLPRDLFEGRRVAHIVFDYSQVMAHTQVRGNEPINRLYPDQTEIGAYSAWPWGVSRILDGLEMVGDASRIDMNHIGITGCSFAGKMALFAAALDERIALTIAQEPGGGGVASWRVSETLGNVETLSRTNYAWFKESLRHFSSDVARLPIDHHEVAALIAPRALLVIGNTDYEWLADESTYISCQAARAVWQQFGVADRMGFSIEGGHPHCMLPKTQYAEVRAFIDKFLLGNDTVGTLVTRAEMFKNAPYLSWMPWAMISAGTVDGKYFTTPNAKQASRPDAVGFIRRWWLLDPIEKPNRTNTVFTDSYLREAFAYEYFKHQADYLPKKDGERVKLNKQYVEQVYDEKVEAVKKVSSVRQMTVPQTPTKPNAVLAWHNVESTGYNVQLYRFARQQEQPVYGVLFWAVTVIECDEDVSGIRLAVGSNSASMWWLNGEEALILSGDRRMVMDDAMSAPITLKKGKNTLRGAIINGPGMSNFCVRFIDSEGKPVENLKVVQ